MGGCKRIESQLARLISDFSMNPHDSRILCEDGAEALADLAARLLPQAIRTVESKQYGIFNEPITVYAFASPQSFAKFAGVSEKVIGAAAGNDVYLSGKLLYQMEKVQGILVHELSHVQLSQVLGVVNFNRGLPRWFREGIAVFVADGGGATNVTETKAVEKFIAGEHFIPETKGTLFNSKLPATVELEPGVFYRQSAMFVEFLAQEYPAQFENMLKSLQAGELFEDQFIAAFDLYPVDMLNVFIQTL